MTDRDIYAVHTAFASTEFGERLAANIRYERYNLARLSNPAWTGLLGADVNNLTHMSLTYGLTKAFLRQNRTATPGQFTEVDETILKRVHLFMIRENQS